MLDSPAAGLQRSHGEAHVRFGLRAGRPALLDLRQIGSAKALLPATHGPAPEVVFLNTSGGLTGGDRLSYGVDVGPGCRVVATTQTAERGYASLEGTAKIDLRLTVAKAGRLDWLPQETILFQHAALHRRTTADLAQDATGLFLETVVLGRAAMGETIRDLSFRDTRMIRREGKPVFLEPLLIDTEIMAIGAQPAILGSARAQSTIVLVARGAEDAAPALRQLLTVEGVTGAVSGFDGKCVVRLTAADGWPLRQQVLALLRPLQGQSPPRVWQH